MFVIVAGNADALGLNTTTYSTTKTAAAPGMAFGMATSAALAQGSNDALPYTAAVTTGSAGGGITSSHTSTFSIDFSYGPSPVSATISLTFVSTHGFEPLAVNSLIHDAYSGLAGSAFPGIA